MNKRRKLLWGTKCLSIFTAFALTLGATSFAVDQSSSKVNEQDIPITVGDLITSEALGIGTVQVSGANVRENPTKDAEVVTVLESGAQFAVVSKDGDWYRISVNGTTGFVSSEYVSLQNQGELELGYGVLQGDAVNLRAAADDTSDTLTTLTGDDVVELVGIFDGWYEVRFGELTGFVRSDLINSIVYIAADRIFEYAVVNCAAINLRTSPEADAEKVDTLYSGSLCTLLEENEDWYKVQYGDTVGYVLAEYMTTTNDASAGSTEIETANEAAEREAEEQAAAEEAARQAAEAQTQTASGSASNTIAAPAYTLPAEDPIPAQNDSGNISGDTSAPESEYAAVDDSEAWDDSEDVYAEPWDDSDSDFGGAEGSWDDDEYAAYDDSADDYYYDDYAEYDDYEDYEDYYEEPSYDYSEGSYIVSVAEQYLGVPYVWGGTTPSGFDCSGFTQYVFRECGYSINRVADAQYYNGTYVSYGNLEAGDLVFFCNTYSASGITHVGIYIGDGEFIHCAGGCVKISSLSESYYASRYYAAVRVI